MGNLARSCPHCGALNASEAERCHRCQRRLLAPWIYGLLSFGRGVLGERTPFTALFFLICALSFALMSLSSGLSLMGAASASAQLRFGGLFIVPDGSFVAQEPWRYLSAAFVHFGAVHLGFNMLALGGLGGALEPKLGSARFAVLYVLAATLGFVASDYYHRLAGAPLMTGGASGALFGLMGAASAHKAARREPDWKRSLFGLFAFVIIMTFLVPASMMKIDHAAHLGGLATGLGLGYAFGLERHPERRARLFQLGAALAVVFSIVSVVACQLSPEWKIQRQLEIQWGLDANGD